MDSITKKVHNTRQYRRKQKQASTALLRFLLNGNMKGNLLDKLNSKNRTKISKMLSKPMKKAQQHKNNNNTNSLFHPIIFNKQMYLDHTIPHKNSWQVLGGSNNDRRRLKKGIHGNKFLENRCLFKPPIKRTLKCPSKKASCMFTPRGYLSRLAAKASQKSTEKKKHNNYAFYSSSHHPSHKLSTLISKSAVPSKTYQTGGKRWRSFE